MNLLIIKVLPGFQNRTPLYPLSVWQRGVCEKNGVCVNSGFRAARAPFLTQRWSPVTVPSVPAGASTLQCAAFSLPTPAKCHDSSCTPQVLAPLSASTLIPPGLLNGNIPGARFLCRISK